MIDWYQVFRSGRGQAGKSWSKDLSSLPVHRLYYIHRGRARMKTRTGWIELLPGNLCFFPAFSVLESRCDDLLDHSFLHFSTSRDDQRSLWDLKDSDMSQKKKDEESLIISLFDKIQQLCQSETTEARMTVRGAMDILLAPYIKDKNPSSKRFIHGILQFIEDHIGEPLSLEKLASESGYAPHYFSDKFRAEAGIPPIQYLNRRRVEKSQEMLHRTDLPVQEIAYRFGFQDAHYFSRLFRKEVGLSPRQYRENLRLQKQNVENVTRRT